MKYELKSIGFWSFVKIAFVVNFLAGILAGLFVIPFGLILTAVWELGSFPDPGGYADEGSSIGAMFILLPILGGFGAAVMGTFFQSIVILAYNMLSSLLGGLHLNLRPCAEVHYERPQVAPSVGVNPSAIHRQPPPPPPPPKESRPRMTPDQPDTPPGQPGVAPPSPNTYSPPPGNRSSDNDAENR